MNLTVYPIRYHGHGSARRPSTETEHYTSPCTSLSPASIFVMVSALRW